MQSAIREATDKWNKCLVTGGAGFIGSHICEEALKLGKEVTCIDNLVAGKYENIEAFMGSPNFKYYREDVTHRLAMMPLFKDVDVVFHNAASKAVVCTEDPRRDLDVNAWGTYTVAECAIAHKVKKVIHASTGSVYGEMTRTVDESHPLKPTSYYGVSKLAGERYLEAYKQYHDLNYSIIRYFHVYGPRQEHNDYGGVIPIFIRRALNDQPLIIYGDGSQTRSFTHVKDDVKANFLLSDPDLRDCDVYNSASGVRITISQLATMVLRLMGKRHLRIQYKDWRLGDIRYMVPVSKKLQRMGLDFDTNLEKGIKETIACYVKYFNE